MHRDIWVDFNDVDSDRTAITLLRFATNQDDIEVGRQVTAGDDEGNRCRATVVDRQGGIVKLALDLSTFETPESCGSAKAQL